MEPKLKLCICTSAWTLIGTVHSSISLTQNSCPSWGMYRYNRNLRDLMSLKAYLFHYIVSGNAFGSELSFNF